MILYWIMNPINDISTKVDPPVAFQQVEAIGKDVSLKYNNDFVEIQKKLHPEIKPLELEQSIDSVFSAAETVAKEQEDWKLHVTDKDSKRLQGTATTSMMKFKDDFVIQLESNDSGGTTVHMRSKSRLGRNDFGANANRIQNFFSDLKVELQSSHR